MNHQSQYTPGSMRPHEQYEHDLEAFKRQYGLKITPKSRSTFMKLLYAVSLMWIWNRKFMTGYTTTIGSTIYTTRELNTQTVSDLALLRHEVQHIEDSRRFGAVPWALLYLFPQSLAVLALLAFFHPVFLVALVALGPWPAPFRVWAELRGYARTYWTWDEFERPWPSVDWEERMHETFCGWGYYCMAWGWTSLKNRMWRMLHDERPGPG